MSEKSGQTRTLSVRVRRPVFEYFESLPRGTRSKILNELVEKWYEKFTENLEIEARELEERAVELRAIAKNMKAERSEVFEEARQRTIIAAASLKPDVRQRLMKTPVGKGLSNTYAFSIKQFEEWAREL